MMDLPTIPQFYSNKNIFITGGSGFIGKVLIEKLLRSCPDLKKIYLLLREKKGRSPEERIKAITEEPLFDVLKSQNPEFVNKIAVIKGDVKELGLGLNPEDRKKLIDEINFVYHGAASIRFNDHLSDAIILNTRGTRELVKLALEMKNLEVLVHISTTYCNCDRQVVEEKLYPAHADWKKTIEVAENIDRHTLNVLTEKYIKPLPNTYTFAKSLAEHVVYDMCDGKIPTVIYRPSIVVSSVHEPIQGWIDNFNGPMGLLIAKGKGVLRTGYCDPDVVLDYVPVDITVKTMIIASWKQVTQTDATLKLSPSFFNGSNFERYLVSFRELLTMSETVIQEIPLQKMVWYPKRDITKCHFYFLVKFYICDLFLALVCDGLLKLFGKKPQLLRIQRKIFTTNMALSHFTLNQWTFINTNCANLQNELLPSDLKSFSYLEDETPILEYFKNATVGVKKYLLKENEPLEKTKKDALKMWILSRTFDVFWYLILLWLLFVKTDIVSNILHIISGVFLHLKIG